jgi:alkylation response protein AidB-like acyl-CoA dehydrogenase
VRFAFSEEQEMLRATARRFLESVSSPARVRATMKTEAGFDSEVWQRIGGELGWPSLTIPEAYGGAGLGAVELIAILEEAGRALLCAPLFSTVCLGVNALLTASSEEQKEEYLPGIAAGTTRVTLASAEADGRWDASAVRAVARRAAGDYVLSGVKRFVLDGHTAHLLLVTARAPETTGDRGVSLFAIPADTPGVTRRALPTMDMTRKQAEIRLDEVRVPARALVGAEGAAASALERVLELACVALAAEQVGGMEKCLEMAVEYAKVRVQFGRPIGSFQAVKHKCADMLLRVESARSASYYAAWAAAAGDPELPVLASLAKAYASDAYFHCASENIQIHGGIGFTWEHDAHLYFKRARASEALFGDPAAHREKVARRIGLGDPQGESHDRNL